MRDALGQEREHRGRRGGVPLRRPVGLWWLPWMYPAIGAVLIAAMLLRPRNPLDDAWGLRDARVVADPSSGAPTTDPELLVCRVAGIRWPLATWAGQPVRRGGRDGLVAQARTGRGRYREQNRPPLPELDAGPC
jgi:hypothetical protein